MAQKLQNQSRWYQTVTPISELNASDYEADDQMLYDHMRQLTLAHSAMDLIKTQKSLIKAGSVHDCTAHGAINPGVVFKNNNFMMLCRAEPDETVWGGDFLVHQAAPLWCVFDLELNIKQHVVLTSRGFDKNSRPEDWRLFEYNGKVYANHSVYIMVDRDRWIVKSKVAISEVDLITKTLNLRWMLEPPFEAADEEKNWSFFVHNGDLLCVYSFKPYIILKIDLENGKTEKIIDTKFDYQWYEKRRFIGNSTNVIHWNDNSYILFIHDFLEPRYDQRNRAYMQYGVLISKETLLPTHIIPRPLVMGGDEPGRHPGVHYISSLVNRTDSLYAFYGQGDSHTCVTIFNKTVLSELFNKYPIHTKVNPHIGSYQGIDSRKGIVVSFPRSGLNWLRYCLEHLTGLRTAGRTKIHDWGDLVVYRTHNVRDFGGHDSCHCPFYDSDGKPIHNKVILLIRDYRETFIRMTKSQQGTVPSPEEIRSGQVFHFRDYFENLKAFDEFMGDKLLVYYGDLISDFSEVKRVLDFLDLSYDLSTFDIDYHQQQSLELYDIQHKSYTKDNLYDLYFHRNQVSPEVVEAIDDFANNNYKDIVNKYF